MNPPPPPYPGAAHIRGRLIRGRVRHSRGRDLRPNRGRGGVRVGFEDNVYLYKGELATSNAQFVNRVVNIAKEIGRDVASIDEAREILGLQ